MHIKAVKKTINAKLPLSIALFAASALLGEGTVQQNMPGCSGTQNTCGCPTSGDDTAKDDGTGCNPSGDHGASAGTGCIKVYLGLEALRLPTAWRVWGVPQTLQGGPATPPAAARGRLRPRSASRACSNSMPTTITTV